MAKAAEEEIEERVVPARREPQAGRVTVPDQLREPCIVEVAAQITCGDGAVPENGRENCGGNQQKTPDVLAHERDGLREDGCGRLGLGNAFHDYVISEVGRVRTVVLRQEKRLGECEGLRCIAANIS